MAVVNSSSGSPSDAPRVITPSSSELKNTKYGVNNLQAALEALHQDGFVVLKSVVDVTHIDHINSYMTKEADDLVKNNTKPFNQGVNCRSQAYFPRHRKLMACKQIFFRGLR
jgi:hypothetical protein